MKTNKPKCVVNKANIIGLDKECNYHKDDAPPYRLGGKFVFCHRLHSASLRNFKIKEWMKENDIIYDIDIPSNLDTTFLYYRDIYLTNREDNLLFMLTFGEQIFVSFQI